MLREKAGHTKKEKLGHRDMHTEGVPCEDKGRD